MKTTVVASSDQLPQMRVLVCRTCRALEELPDFQGHPDDDVFLEYVVQEHQGHMGQLFRLPIGVWLIEGARNQLMKQMMGHNEGLVAFDPKFYEVRNTFKADALICFKAHNRPKEGCSDFRSDKKRLFPDTKGERKELGLSVRERPNTWLCDFCPVKSYYEQKARGE